MKINLRTLATPFFLAATVSLSVAALHAADPPTGVATPGTPVQTAAPTPAPVKRTTERPALLAAGVTAPEFTATDMDGKEVKLSDFKGKMVVIDFWASWCPPCNAAMPHNQLVTKKLADAGTPIVFLAVDNSENPRLDDQARHDAFSNWVKKHSELDALKFVYIDPKVIRVSSASYHVSGIPTQYVVDPQGVIRASFVGYGGPNDDLENAVKAAAQPFKADAAKVASR